MNNIEELSKPVGFVGLKGFSLLADGNLGVISPNSAFGEAPVYSHEYVAALIAQLEAAQKENGELVMSLNVANDSTGIWKDRAQKAEAALSAANEKPKPISFDELADRVQFVTGGIRMSFDPLNCKGHQIVPFMNFNSLSRIVEMYRTTETYHLAGFTVEGSEL
ncbi:hypothetical protein WFR23_00550 [Yersinia enterocolitica]